MVRWLLVTFLFFVTPLFGAGHCSLELEMLGGHGNANPTAPEFLARHPEGGFLAAGNRIFFAAPTAAAAAPLLKELGVTPTPLTVKELPGWQVYDVSGTSTIPPRLKDLHGIFSVYDRIRCYSACGIASGYAKGALNIGGNEVRFWVTSPLMKEVTGSPPAAGDVILLGEKAEQALPVEHVATYVSPSIVFQKANPMSESPFELVPKTTFAREYNPEKYPAQRLFRPIENLDQYVARHRRELPEELIGAMTELAQIELEMEKFLLTSRTDRHAPQGKTEAEQDAWAERFHARIKQVAQQSEKIEELATKALAATDKKPSVEFLWTFVLKRSQSLPHYPDPFD